MRLALNATALLGPLTGIGRYTRELALGLAADDSVQTALFLGTRWARKVPPELAAAPASRRAAGWARALLPFAYDARRWLQERQFRKGCAGGAFDVYHEPNILALPFDGPTVITVHDLSWIRFPESHPAPRVRAMNRFFEPGLRRAALVVTDSEFVKRELMEVFGYPAQRIRAIPLACEPIFRPRTMAETQPVLARHGLVHGHYLIAVGTLEPRKNLQLALRAFRALPRPLRSRFPLVLIGMKGWKTGALEEEVAPLVRAGEVRQLGYVPREDLAVLTAGATALVYPSIYEGFGLPPLEAMACAVPVIVSDVSSLPEVVGDSALKVGPDDVDGLQLALRELLEAPALRGRLADAGLARSARFSWARCVQDTTAAYRDAARGAGGPPDRISPSTRGGA